MADPISIIGTVSAIANLVDLMGKTVQSLQELRSRWKDADFIFMSLVSQLTTLRASLNRIHHWLHSVEAELYYQLQLDLEASTSCCWVLAEKLDSFVTQLHESGASNRGRLDVKGKFKLVFGSSSVDEVLRMIDRQTNALALLLTACNW
jgi:hypothetical protein